MDLAQLIVNAAAQQLKESSMAETCEIRVSATYKYTATGVWHFEAYSITATPMTQHVLLQYKSMTWKLPRSDTKAWEESECVQRNVPDVVPGFKWKRTVRITVVAWHAPAGTY
jgi:hypothetical protein